MIHFMNAKYTRRRNQIHNDIVKTSLCTCARPTSAEDKYTLAKAKIICSLRNSNATSAQFESF